MSYMKNLYNFCCEECEMYDQEIESQEADTMTMPEWAAFHGFHNLQLSQGA